MNDLFNETARQHYLSALQNWKALNEQGTNHCLNAARDALLNGRHSTAFSDADTRRIMPDLTAHEFFALYGDPISKDKRTYSDWLQNEASPESKALVEKAERHLKMLTNIGVEPALKVA